MRNLEHFFGKNGETDVKSDEKLHKSQIVAKEINLEGLAIREILELVGCILEEFLDNFVTVFGLTVTNSHTNRRCTSTDASS